MLGWSWVVARAELSNFKVLNSPTKYKTTHYCCVFFKLAKTLRQKTRAPSPGAELGWSQAEKYQNVPNNLATKTWNFTVVLDYDLLHKWPGEWGPAGQGLVPSSWGRAQQHSTVHFPGNPVYCSVHLPGTVYGNTASYSRWKYEKATHMRDIPHWLKCMLECHRLGNEVKTYRWGDVSI